MKKVLMCLILVSVCMVISCKTAPAEVQPVVVTEVAVTQQVTQPTTDDALRQVYNTYQAMLDMSNSQDYTVKWGDTLSQITRRYYGDLSGVGDAGPRNGFYFPVIMMASPNCQIADPDLIIPGMKLQIIDLDRNLANPAIRQAIKDSLVDIAHVYSLKQRPMEEAGLMRLSNSL